MWNLFYIGGESMLKNASAMQYPALAFCVAGALALGACGLDPAGSYVSSSGVTSHASEIDAGKKPGSTADAGSEDVAQPPPIDASRADVGAGTDDDAGQPPCEGSGTSVTFVAPMASSPSFGTIGGQAFDDVCTAGEALVGINLVGSQLSPFSITHVQAVCAPIALDAQCAVAIGAPVALVDHGTTPGNPQQLACASGSVMVGIHVFTGLFVDAIAIDCAPYVHDVGGTTFTRGAVTTVGPLGGTGGMANNPYTCPNGEVANELAGATGTWIQSLRIGCATPFVP